MEVNGKPSMGIPPLVLTVKCWVCYPRSGGYPGVLFRERECLCCFQHKHEKKFLGRGYPRGGFLGEEEACGWFRGP